MCITIGILTGCNKSPMPDLSEEQTQLISEYAAGLILKYDKNFENMLLEPEELAYKEEKQAEYERKMEEYKSTQEKAEAEKEAESNSKESGGTSEMEVMASSVEEALGIEGIHIAYKGFEISDSYPNAGEDETYFEVISTPGNDLLIMKFTISNNSKEDEINILDSGARFRYSFNGGNAKAILSTLLMDDLSTFKGNIPIGESEEVVLLAEVSEVDASQIAALSLSIQIEENSVMINLQ